jgi:transcriptional antiterminator
MAKILSDIETKRELAKAFGVTSRTVNNALNCVNNSLLAQKIRKRALDLGCKAKGEETIIVS